MINLFTAIGLTPGGSSTVHIYTQTIHRTTQSTQIIHKTTQLTNWEKYWPCPVFASYTLACLTTEGKARKNLINNKIQEAGRGLCVGLVTRPEESC
jgi:arylamine N-acetyltransferase